MKRFKPLIICSLIFLSFALAATLFSRPLIILNYTNSLPHGFYRVVKTTDFDYRSQVIFSIPEEVKDLVADRGYLRPDGYLIKPVAALAGDHGCNEENQFFVNGQSLGLVKNLDREGRPLPSSKFCGQVPAGKILVGIAGKADSFDSRYFGAIQTHDIIGVAQPLFLF